MIAPGSLPPILPARSGHVLTVTMNRPDTRNALSEHMMRLLQLTLDEAVEDESVRVIVLAAKGPAFSSGHDLKEMTAHRDDADEGLAYYRALFAQCSHLMQTIVRHPKPIIAQVHALATAAGCQLVASCDLAVASSEARFATPGVNIGLFCSTPMVALSRAVPRKAAMEMLLTGESISAEDAKRIGLVNRVVAPTDLEAETLTIARQIASKPRTTLKTGKVAFQHQLELGLSNAYHYVAEVMTQNMLHEEAEEGIGAFLEKRVPKWPEK
jgi:enoyl-CoA hydratase/carnithine racemase